MPRVASAGHSSKPERIIHAALTATLLMMLGFGAPLSLFAGVIVWRSRGGAA